MPVLPDGVGGGFYGHDGLDPEEVLRNGLEWRGDDWCLLGHALQKSKSAFRGTTSQVVFPDGSGAAAWADEGGHVFEICGVPTWNVNKHLEGRNSDFPPGTYGGNPMCGEQENAVPASVPPEHIRRYGRVVTSRNGTPYVPQDSWVRNPKFDETLCEFCESSLNEPCEVSLWDYEETIEDCEVSRD